MTPVSEALRCRGMRDLDPGQMTRFRRIEDEFRATCTSWGYSEIRTPIIEHLHLFTSSGTLSPQMLGRVYSFLDWDGWSGERVVLRPDATIPAARVYWEHFGGEIAKLFYVENIFRFAASDDQREVWQCGVELFGDTWPSGDLELIAVVRHLLRRLGFPDLRFSLSHTGVVRAILATAGYTAEEALSLYDRLLDGDLSLFTEIEQRLPQLGAPLGLLLDLTGGQAGALENLRSAFAGSVPLMQHPLDDLSAIAAVLDSADCPYDLDLTTVRDFEYYTGPVFRVSIAGHNVASGGRYDGLVAAQQGRSIPACGFAVFVDPLVDLMAAGQASTPEQLVHVRPAGPGARSVAMALTASCELQERGFAADLVAADDGMKHRWQVTVDADSTESRYQLADRSTGAVSAADSTDALVALLDNGLRA
jgi:histidyl-tRNA synthetase